MKIILFGSNGQVGWELQRSLAPLGSVISYDRHAADFEDVPNLEKIVDKIKPDIIVNAAAYTNVDQAETDSDRAQIVNSDAVAALAKSTKSLDALLVHYSTDYVFDGSKQAPYIETDVPQPLNIYGKTKLAGELAIKESGCNHLIFRTSWVYSHRGKNFVKTMIKLAETRDELEVIDDQFGTPTSAELVADVTALALYKIINNKERPQDIYHLTASGKTSWYEYAQSILTSAVADGARFKVNPEQIQPVKTKDYQLKATRPGDSTLNTNKLEKAFNITMPPWETSVQRIVTEILLTMRHN